LWLVQWYKWWIFQPSLTTCDQRGW
jgi:hypothetical protein